MQKINKVQAGSRSKVGLGFGAFIFFLNSGCLSTSAGTYRAAEIRGTLSKVSWVTPLSDQMKTAQQFDRVLHSPQETLKLYCSNGKPRRTWNLPVRAIVPRPPAGIPIDQASEIKGRVYQAFRNIIGPAIFIDEPAPLAAAAGEVGAGSRVLAVSTADPEALLGKFRETRLSDGATTLMVGYDAHSGLFLGVIDAMEFAMERSGSPAEDKWKLKGVAGGTRHNPSLMGAVWTDRRFKSAEGDVVYPVYPAGVLEAGLLPMHFTMLVPPGVQKKYFAELTPERGFFVREDGTFDLGDAVGGRQRLWNAYFNKSIVVEEAQTSDPDVVQFNIRMDLDLFCAYARPVQDLLTK